MRQSWLAPPPKQATDVRELKPKGSLMGRGNAVAPPYQSRSFKHVGSMFLGCSLLVSSLPLPSARARRQYRHRASWQPAVTPHNLPTPEGLSSLRWLPNSSI